MRATTAQDRDAIWAMLEPVIRAGETYAPSRQSDRASAPGPRLAPTPAGFVAEADGRFVALCYLEANHAGGGSHVANCGQVTARGQEGRGTARATAPPLLVEVARRGCSATQFNLVVVTNARANTLWQCLGFAIVGRLPAAFRHPRYGMVDALVMRRPFDVPQSGET